MNELQMLMNDVSEWSDTTFGANQRNPAIVHHLKKEVDELIEALTKSVELGCDDSIGVGEFGRQVEKTQMEFADCFMLLLDSASHYRITAEQLIEFTREKLEINKARKWGKPDVNGVVEHIKPEPDNEQKNTKLEKLKDLLELVSEVDIMYHDEHKEYFFEWVKDGKFITVWLGDYV